MSAHTLQEQIRAYYATMPGPLDFENEGIKADVIGESTSATGVTVDGVLLKDSGITTTGTAALTGVVTFGGAAHAGLLHGAGTSSTPYTMTGASKSALSYYVTTADTADSNRCAYLRLYLTGATGGGEAIRAFTTVTSTATPAARGIHSSVSFGTGGAVSGEAMAIKGTFHVANRATAVGTSSAVQAEIYTDGSSSDITGTLALFHGTVSGTGAGTVDAKAYLLNLSGVTDGAGEMVRRAQNEPTWTGKTCLVKCLINGNVTYLIGVEL